MGDCTELLEAVEAAYEVAAHPTSLPRAIGAIGAYLDVRGVHLISVEGERAQLVAVAERDAPEKARFAPAWCSAELAQVLGHAVPGEVACLGNLAASTHPDARLLLRALPWQDCVLAALPGNVLLLAPVRQGPEGEHTRQVVSRLAVLLPHLSRALQLAKRWAEPVATISAAGRLLRDLPMACMLTDAAGRCIDTNASFENITEPLAMQVVGGRVRFQDSYLQDSWQSALRETAQTVVPRALLAVSARGKQWKVHLLPVQCQAGDGRELQHLILAVYEEQGGAPAADPERFAAVGKLTPAELDVLSGLLQGYTGKVIARSRGASVNTVRSQIMSILSKTGHRSQKELIAAFGASTFDPSAMESTY